MPNWCSNEIEIDGTSNPKEFSAFVQKAKLVSESPESIGGMFNRLVPMPSELLATTRGSEIDRKEFSEALGGNKEFEYTNWYDWRLAHWGTKWDLSEDGGFVYVETISASLSYDTAWSPANAVWEKVSEEFKNLVITIKYYEEGIGFIGKTVYQGGLCVHDVCHDISPEMYSAAGASLDKEGKVDWDKDQYYNLAHIIDQFC